MAYVTVCDAARLAVTAHMHANGYRARPIAGVHQAVGDYAEAHDHDAQRGRVQTIRRRRDRAEYDDIVVGRADFDTDLRHAEAIIDAVEAAQ